MWIIGCDYHPSVQQIAWVDTETGEMQERRLKHNGGEAEGFYRELKEKGFSVRLGMETTGHARWFERLLKELGFELLVGDAAKIRAKQVKRQKNDRQDAQHLLLLLLKDDFPRIWAPPPENRDRRQLLLHRHRLVQMRTRVMNQLQAVAMNEGIRRKRGLWTKHGRAELESLSLPTWTGRRRQELLELLDQFDPSHRSWDRIDVWIGLSAGFQDQRRAFGRGTCARLQEYSESNARSSTKERSFTELRFASFPTPFCCAERPVKGRDEPPAGALDRPLRAGREVLSISA